MSRNRTLALEHIDTKTTSRDKRPYQPEKPSSPDRGVSAILERDLWDLAFRQLTEEEKAMITPYKDSKLDILETLRNAAETKRAECERRG